jgi:alpha-beta hydrolase superfamily lysophospholipase
MFTAARRHDVRRRLLALADGAGGKVGRVERVTSNDGTSIAYDRVGRGPAVVLVGGAAVTRSENAGLADELASRFTVFNYDRRGRGDSTDTQPYAVEREIEDLAAVVGTAGGTAYLYGVSSGGALALQAAAAGVPAERIAVYEVPYDMSDGAAQRHRAYADELAALQAQGRRGDMFARFMRLAGSSEEDIAGARASEFWPACEAVAPTLAYDAAVMGDNRPPADRLARVTQPVLVATGGASADSFVGGGGSFFDDAADALVAVLPDAERTTVPGQWHQVDPKALAPLLVRFYAG